MNKIKYIDVIEKYSDNEFLTKSEIQSKMGSEFEELVWVETREYRERYKMTLPLKTISNFNMFVHITPSIISLEIKLHKLMTQLGLKSFMYDRLWKKLEGPSLSEIKEKCVLEEVLELSFGYDYKVNPQILLDIVNDKFKANDNDHFFGSKLYEFLLSINKNQTFSTSLLIKNVTLLSKLNNPILRQNNDGRKNNIHNGFDCYELKSKLNDLDNFLNNYKHSNIFLKAIVSYFYIKYGKFFREYNEIAALMSFYLIIGSEYPEFVPYIRLGEKIIKHIHEINSSYENSKTHSCNITYFAHKLFNIVANSLNECVNTFDQYLFSIKENNILKSTSEISINVKAKQLLKINPNLSKKQALFYLTHNDPNAYYSIQDFRAKLNSSYETCRYSLDNLVKEGFYKKEKNGKKYVYQCIKFI